WIFSRPFFMDATHAARTNCRGCSSAGVREVPKLPGWERTRPTDARGAIENGGERPEKFGDFASADCLIVVPHRFGDFERIQALPGGQILKHEFRQPIQGDGVLPSHAVV